MTAGPEQTDSQYHEASILKRIAKIQKALIGPVKQWYSHLSLEKKELASVLLRILNVN